MENIVFSTVYRGPQRTAITARGVNYVIGNTVQFPMDGWIMEHDATSCSYELNRGITS